MTDLAADKSTWSVVGALWFPRKSGDSGTLRRVVTSRRLPAILPRVMLAVMASIRVAGFQRMTS